MEIRCKKGDCSHNTGCSCSAKTVEIGRAVNCHSYHKDEIKKNIMIENGNIFEVAEELVPRNLRNVPLACRMKSCLYNNSELCCANGITVIDGETAGAEDAECATYIQK